MLPIPDTNEARPFAMRDVELTALRGRGVGGQTSESCTVRQRPTRMPKVEIRVEGAEGTVIAGVAFDGRQCFLFARVAYDAGDERLICLIADLGGTTSPDAPATRTSFTVETK